jgi:crotonobetainyl-CoA:carnitine CoA-transferase CaiB-like acyl-CoA transferase
MNGRTGERIGNRDKIMAPHGCYHCLGEDEWVAIAVSGDDEWRSFCKAIGSPEWTEREEFNDELSRCKNQDELDRYVEEWTRRYQKYDVMEILQKAGVAAGASLSVQGVAEDTHLKEREFFVETEHPVMGKLPYARLPWRLSNAPKGNYHYAPLLGEHNEYVFGELLGLSKEEITRLVEEKVIH